MGRRHVKARAAMAAVPRVVPCAMGRLPKPESLAFDPDDYEIRTQPRM